jgi:hypothetical protein
MPKSDNQPRLLIVNLQELKPATFAIDELSAKRAVDAFHPIRLRIRVSSDVFEVCLDDAQRTAVIKALQNV